MATVQHGQHSRGPFAPWRRPYGQRFIRHWGDCSRIAAACGVTAQAVSQWKRVPERHLLIVAGLLSTTPERLRPDIAQRKLMTSTSMHPSDAAAALALLNSQTERAVSELEDLYLATQKATANLHLARSHVEEANLSYEQARMAVRRSRAAMARARRRMREAGMTIPDFAVDVQPPDHSPPPPSAPQGIGGVKPTGGQDVDRIPPQRVSPRNS
ncbi:Cro/CI family transcriptional regulator [Acetobacter fabarum]|uniref:Uncharacterized protein n=1 Tax=Acetobacter fabarum TaxID=483199 RepID=A0A269XWZ7_9PROT|nr:Cro/CI family transcriptional regulator [Acetobacter fabarum]PAK77817.1 hypothetical protein B8X00_09065 [Acetobacter fabarum]PEN28173.1 hypothetical protein CRM93_03870 [Acetobacter fabarum]